ncbi:MAG TPA: NAD-dependent epimerase/dehydratase family protein [Lysobacter sp.]|nr:NAD-dependent epimerase/dehydratase family protein [Lysobacter sp.]
MKTALVFGASGQIGAPLLERLQGDDWNIVAVSRSVHGDMPRLTWKRGDFANVPELPSRVDALFCCGPLDLFSQWYAGSDIEAPRVVAFGSTSVHVKRDSTDPRERDLARRLREGEQRLLEAAAAHGARATVLRPTLVYGRGRDATLSRIAGLARRHGRFPLPRNANGLRQPVHVDDLADAALTVAKAERLSQSAYDLPGGETLSYPDMVGRVLACLDPPAKLIELPSPLFKSLLVLARMGGRAQEFGDAALARMREDLVFEAGPARRDFGYAPRTFAPTAEMFKPQS